MKKLLLLPALVYCFHLQAQTGLPRADKLDAQLKLWVHDAAALRQQQPALYKAGPVADPLVPVIFKTDGTDPRAIVAKNKGRLFSTIGNIYTAEIPISRMQAFASEKSVLKMEASKDMELHNDKGRQLIGADLVSNGQLPGGTPYTGKNVIVGIIDTGIDFLHPDFRKKDDATKTRILHIWDQTLNGTNPSGFAYGSEWTQTQVNAELTSPGVITERDSSGHGTHVTGTAAGLRGVAFDADIISVKTPLVSNGDYKFATSAKTLDAVAYIYQKAAALGKPCVVNMSLGFNFGAPHDGTSLFEQGIDQLVTTGNSFIVCASAGNEGNSFGHNGGFPLTSDSVWMYVNGLNGATWYAVNNSDFDDSIWVSVSVDSTTINWTNGIQNQKTIFQTPWMKVKDIKMATGGFTYDIIDPNGDTTATVKLVAASYDATRTELYVYPRDRFVLSTANNPSRCNLYKVSFKGSGSFHSWLQALNGFGASPPNFGAKINARYKAGDNNHTVGIPASAKKVFAVGAYINKASYTDILGRTQRGLNTSNQSTGTIAYFSSLGPTLDNRMKPEFCAPGLNVASSLSRYSDKDSSSIVDAQTAVFSGTSMSCPFTAGALALYLEKYPGATFEGIRAAVDSAVKRDAFTNIFGALPNNRWGYGKLDIYKAMGSQWNTGIADGSVAPVNELSIYPNPAHSSVSIAVPAGSQWAELSVYDINGRVKKTVSLAQGLTCTVDINEWNPGIYFYEALSTAGKTTRGKIVVH